MHKNYYVNSIVYAISKNYYVKTMLHLIRKNYHVNAPSLHIKLGNITSTQR